MAFEVLFVDNMKQKTTSTITRSSTTTTTIRQHGNLTQDFAVDKTGLQIVPINMCLAAIGLLA
ncbi:MAG TPA: hypothetical protein VKA40_03200 [Nitrososphaera sp.]|nr:hypothetical protein [Nitrososphaera sp.]